MTVLVDCKRRAPTASRGGGAGVPVQTRFGGALTTPSMTRRQAPAAGAIAPHRAARMLSGFTMIELLITIIIAGILAAVAAPNMAVFIKNTTRSTNINALVSALTLARSIAVKRNAFVTVCASGTGTACNPPASASTFDNGWIVFSDLDGDQTVDAGETVRRIYQPDIGTGTTLRGWVNTTPLSAAITYGGDGAATNLTAGAVTLFRYCDSRGQLAGRQIALSVIGQPQPPVGVTTCP